MTVCYRFHTRRVVAAVADAAKLAAIKVANFIDREREARIEAELDRKQEELRRTILELAEAIGVEAHEARKAMIRESFLASGRVPDSDRKHP